MTETDLAHLIHEDGILRSYIRRRMPAVLRPLLDVDDILQQVFLSARKMLHAYQDRDGALIRSWLRGVAIHRIISAGRARDSRRCVNEGELQPDECAAETMWAPQRTPSSAVAAKEARARVIAAVAGLPPRQQSLVQLCDLQGQDPATVARRLKIARSTVYNNLAAANTKLVSLLGPAKCT